MLKKLLATLVIAGTVFTPVSADAASANVATGPTFGSAVVPGSACFSAKPIHLTKGVAYVANKAGNARAGSKTKVFGIHAGHAFFGAGEKKLAILPLVCDNNGGTADGQELFSLMVFTVTGTTLKGIGLITPVERPKGEHVTIMTSATIDGATILAQEYFYGPSDSTCCPSGEALSVWSVKGGHLRYVTSSVHRPANK